jgi:hypothetical protein
MSAPTRTQINTIYFLVPPLGLLFMLFSPFYSNRERVMRGLLTASFLAFFATMGPSLQNYYENQLAALQTQQQP